MVITIVHIGGSEKRVEFEGFDAPRPWARCRYPMGGGVYSFALSHGGIECKRGLTPEWRISDSDLAEPRALAKAEKIRFSVAPFAAYQALKPRAPRKKTEQKTLELFPGASR